MHELLEIIDNEIAYYEATRKWGEERNASSKEGWENYRLGNIVSLAIMRRKVEKMMEAHNE
jgi:hypothetical protein